MASKQWIRSWFTVAGVTALMGASGCAMLTPKAEAYKPPPVGSTWTNSQVNTGSYGSGTAQITVTRGERVWQGRQVVTFQVPTGTTLGDPATSRWLAVLAPTDAVVVTWDPPIGFEFPIEVGKTWVSKHRVENRVANRTADLEATWKVEAYEDVAVPAGTFKAYRVRYSDTIGNAEVYWFSSDLGITVKTSQKRSASHPQGVGTRETELVTQAIRK